MYSFSIYSLLMALIRDTSTAARSMFAGRNCTPSSWESIPYSASISCPSMMEVIAVASVLSSLSGSLFPMLAVRLACGSESMSKTLFPALASSTPKFTVVVVLDTPPFWFAAAMTLHFLPYLTRTLSPSMEISSYPMR